MTRLAAALTVSLAATALPLLSLLAGATPPPADLEAGEQSYAKCMGCHSPDRNRTGPLHCGLLGRAAGTVPGYDYSSAMRDAGMIWTVSTLDRFLQAPLTMLPGTSMGFMGLADATERRNLIAWIATLNETSPLCADVIQP